MGRRSEQLDRQIAAALSRCAEKLSFTGTVAEDLWLWQAKCRGGVKEALALEMPTVYGPPTAKLVSGDPNSPGQLQLWDVTTDQGLADRVYVQSSGTGARRPAGIVMDLAGEDSSQEAERFCRQVVAMGLAGAVTCAKTGSDRSELAQLAALYLGLGKSYAGAVVGDLMRVLDHLESQLKFESEPIILAAGGPAMPIALALAAVDQRISGLVLDFSETVQVSGPAGCPPLFINQYLHLGPNPILSLALCGVPRPILLVDWPTEQTDYWSDVNKTAVLSPADQLDALRRAYRISGHPERIELISSSDVSDRFEMFEAFLKTHFASAS